MIGSHLLTQQLCRAGICLFAAALMNVEASSMTDNLKTKVGLQATVAQQSATELVIEYTLTNGLGVPVVAFDVVASLASGKVSIEKDKAYVILGKGGRVRIIRALFRLTGRIGARPPTLVSVIGPGASQKGAIRLKLPLAELHPYRSPLEEGAGEACEVDSATLEIGWVEQPSNTVLREVTTGDGKYVSLAGAWGSPAQRIVKADVKIPNLTVMRHPDPFERAAIFVE